MSPRTVRAAVGVLALAGVAAGGRPLASTPLRHPAVCRVPDGSWVLTGTTNVNTLEPRHADFQNNDGVRLWRSKDLRGWEPVGLVWNLATDACSGFLTRIEFKWERGKISVVH